MAETSRDRFDVVVLGSGAAGLTAALAAADAGASVGLFEKAELLGGTTALSSGVVWLPANPIAAAAGVEDSRAQALDYLGVAVPRHDRAGARARRSWTPCPS